MQRRFVGEFGEILVSCFVVVVIGLGYGRGMKCAWEEDLENSRDAPSQSHQFPASLQDCWAFTHEISSVSSKDS